MNYLLIQISAKQTTLDLMRSNPSLFGTEREVAHKCDLLRFEIASLTLKLDAWH